jgi:glycosyltransferase involved in cell wall biosynthesis
MPVYNEVNTLDEIIRRVTAVPLVGEIVAVDDGSTDGSRELLQELNESIPQLRVIFHEENAGKGAALRTGFDAASGEVLIIQDADLEYNPEEYPTIVEPILDGRADVVYGSRFLAGPRRVHMFWHALGNRFLTLLSNMLNNLCLSDMETCYKAFRADVLDDIQLRSRCFMFEPEFTAKVARRGFRIYEVPVSYDGRSYDEGKKIGWKDGVKAIWAIIRYRVAD